MQIRTAASSLVALGAVSAVALGTSLVVQDRQDSARQSELRVSSWSVQASTDFGTTWATPIASTGGQFPVRVDTAGLRNRSAYLPLTLRTSVDSLDEALVTVGPGALVDGDPVTAAEVRVRAVAAPSGACAAPAFESGAPSLLAGDGTRPLPVDAATSPDPIVLPGATRTTPGAPVTVCIEVSMEADSPAPDSVLTLTWPVEITRESTDS